MIRTSPALLAAFAVVILLSACGNESETVMVSEGEYPDTPAGAVEAFFQSLEAGDCYTAAQLMTYDGFAGAEDPTIEVFIRNTAGEAEVIAMGDEIRAMPEVESVRFVSKEEALERMREALGENTDIVDGLAGNPLPASYEITVSEPGKVEEVARRFFDHPLVDNTPGSHPPDGVNYSWGYVALMEQLSVLQCDEVADRGYELDDFEVIDSEEDGSDARVKFSATATLGGEENSDSTTFILVRQGGRWKVDYFQTSDNLASPGYNGMLDLMLLDEATMMDVYGEMPIPGLTEEEMMTVTEALGDP